MAVEASTGMPHDIIVLLAAPFVILGALRRHVFRRRAVARQTSSGCLKGASRKRTAASLALMTGNTRYDERASRLS